MTVRDYLAGAVIGLVGGLLIALLFAAIIVGAS
jgi:hypothetical protein